jgi:hypothetical protein
MDPNVGGKNINCKRIEDLIESVQWIPAAHYITNQPPVSSGK